MEFGAGCLPQDAYMRTPEAGQLEGGVELSNHTVQQVPRRCGSPMTATWPPRRFAPRLAYNLIDRAAEDELAPSLSAVRTVHRAVWPGGGLLAHAGRGTGVLR